MDFIQNPEVIVWVQETLGPGYEGLFNVLGIFGTSWGLLLAVAVGFWFFGRRVVYGLLTVALAEGAAKSLLSSGFAVPRPDDPSIVKYERVTSATSFPSGHTATAAAVWVYLGRVTRVPIALSLLIVFAVAVGRLYLGVHYLADVVAGALLGIVIALAWPKVVDWLAPRAARVEFGVWAVLAALGLVAIVAALVVLSPDSPYLWRWGGFAAAAAVALPLEWKFVRYHPSEELGLRLRCALLGALGLAPGVFLHLLGDHRSPAFEAGVLCVTTLWVLLLAPTLFVRWGWSGDRKLERRSSVKHASRVAALAVAVVLAVLAYGSLVEPRMLLDVREETGTVADLPEAWRGARVAVIADMQVGMWGDNTRMIRRVAERIARDSPDLVLMAGDFIYKPGADASDEAREAVEILSPLERTGVPVFAVLGNHDWSIDKEGAPVDEQAGRTIEGALEDAGIEVLGNEARAVQHPSDGSILWVVGIGSHWAGKDRPADAVAAVPTGAPRLVVMHHPDSFESLPAGQAPLAVAGHTHGGQFRLPFLPDWSWMTFAGGDEVHADGWVDSDYGAPGNRLYVNRGIGFSLIPIRIRARAELTYITLEATQGPGG